MTDASPLLSLRAATVADSDLFLALRNDPESVRQSGGVRIDPSDHAAWFRSAVTAADQRLWVAVVGGNDVGYARLRVEDGTGVLSLALVASSRGSGFGVALLEAVQRQVSTDPAVHRLVGEVEPTNDASRRAFERAGFTAEPGADGRTVMSWFARHVPIRKNGLTVQFSLDGLAVQVAGEGSLLDALRGGLGITSVKDGCSPQGQCGCCTVLVDGAPRVACVTPVRRVAGREITTLGGLDAEVRDEWGSAFCATGASQCGFCTPGIILRLEGLRRKERAQDRTAVDRGAVDRALAAHLCRCTGWQTIHEAYTRVATGDRSSVVRDETAAAERARLEGAVPQRVGVGVVLGEGGFADDTAPADALVAVPDDARGWAVGESLADARQRAGKVQGRRTTLTAVPPLALPEGDWALTLRTSWVDPAYLETDGSWCRPGGEPASPVANGGAFGGKATTEVVEVARRLADEHGRPVRVLYTREDAVRRGPKRPPIAAGVRADGTGVLRIVRTQGIASAVASVAPGLRVEDVDPPGPPTSVALRGAGWVESAVLLAGLRRSEREPVEIVAPNGAWATAAVVPSVQGTRIEIAVACGEVLDEVVLRSYCIGAAHMALSWVTSEGLVVDDQGEIHDLTVRSFGVVPSSGMPAVDVVIHDPAARSPSGVESPIDAVNGSDAVFAAVAAAVWCHQDCPPDWPTRQALPI